MTNRATADVVLADRIDAQGRHDASMHVERLERVLDSKRVHYGCEHAHVIAGHAIHAGAREPRAAEDVTAADNDSYLDAGLARLRYLGRDSLNDFWRNTVIQLSHQRFAAELQQHAMVLTRTVIHKSPLRQNRPLILA